ncbi:MAG: FCD domain-containing protein [Stackebrandtia sp.]
MSPAVTNPVKPRTPSWLRAGVATEILAIIDEAGEPVGARHIRTGLLARGLELSESTTARRLRDLDARGFTHGTGSKGRMLTAEGLAEIRSRRHNTSGARLAAATEVKTAGDVVNLLRARRGIEPEAIQDATEHATAADLNGLRELIDEHQRRLDADEPLPRDCALAFHRVAAKPVRNPLVQEMLGLVLHENLDHVEATLDVILVAHHRSEVSVREHSRIVDAMAAGDGQRASELMQHHLNRLLGEVEKFLARYDPGLIDRMLLRG